MTLSREDALAGWQTPNAKHQTPNTKHQTPNTKHQTPTVRRVLAKQTQAGHTVACEANVLAPHARCGDATAAAAWRRRAAAAMCKSFAGVMLCTVRASQQRTAGQREYAFAQRQCHATMQAHAACNGARRHMPWACRLPD
ncbi:hypothetical protein EIQ13_17215 [Xanthomonas campestris pv. campestris]